MVCALFSPSTRLPLHHHTHTYLRIFHLFRLHQHYVYIGGVVRPNITCAVLVEVAMRPTERTFTVFANETIRFSFIYKVHMCTALKLMHTVFFSSIVRLVE